jgi:hypothetical protein
VVGAIHLKVGRLQIDGTAQSMPSFQPSDVAGRRRAADGHAQIEEVVTDSAEGHEVRRC